MATSQSTNISSDKFVINAINENATSTFSFTSDRAQPSWLHLAKATWYVFGNTGNAVDIVFNGAAGYTAWRLGAGTNEIDFESSGYDIKNLATTPNATVTLVPNGSFTYCVVAEFSLYPQQS